MDDQNLHHDDLNRRNFPEPEVPVDAAWAQMKGLLDTSVAPPSPKAPDGFGWKQLLLIGTAGLVIIAGTWIFTSKPQKEIQPPATIYSTTGKPEQFTLPGGPVVFLDQHSSVAVQQQKDMRVTVIQQGGGFIESQAGEKSLVAVGSLQIRPQEAGIFVSYDSVKGFAAIQVQRGTAVVSHGDSSITLSAGESLQYDEQIGRMVANSAADINIASYATRVFEFNNTPLGDALVYIGKAYGVHFTIDNEAVKRCRITSRFDHKPLTEVLDIMAFTIGYTYTVHQAQKEVTIHAERGCE